MLSVLYFVSMYVESRKVANCTNRLTFDSAIEQIDNRFDTLGVLIKHNQHASLLANETHTHTHTHITLILINYPSGRFYLHRMHIWRIR